MALTMPTANPAYRTTYKESYDYSPDILPPIKYNQPPALHHRDAHQLPPRAFPIIPQGPRRRRCPDRALGPGLGTAEMDTERHLSPKPIVRMLPPRELVNVVPPLLTKRKLPRPTAMVPAVQGTDCVAESIQPITKQIMDAICHDVTYTSTTRQATEEAKLQSNKVKPPQSTFEMRADIVKQRPHKYEQFAELWQKVAGIWDRAQARPRTDRPVIDPTAKLTPSKLLPRRKPRSDAVEINEKIHQLTSEDELATPYVRQCPGYAGFIPRSPIEASLERPLGPDDKQSIMKASYRRYPLNEYSITPKSRTGPLSRTVTLTYPYNPFNKIEKRNSSGPMD